MALSQNNMWLKHSPLLLPFDKTKAIYHWERQKKGSTAEVDFIAEVGSEIYPIECKSGKSNKLKSLRLLLEEKVFKTSLRCYSGNTEKETWSITKNNDEEYQATVMSISLRKKLVKGKKLGVINLRHIYER